MTEVDDRVEVECCDCGTRFMALGTWQVRCRSCYAAFKAGAAPPVDAIQRVHALEAALAVERGLRLAAEDRARRAEVSAARAHVGSVGLSREDLRRIRLLVHPDKHPGSAAAHTAFLAVNRAMGG